MRKFKCTVTRVDEYEIEIDESVIDAEYLKEFATVFFDLANLEEVAEHLAQMKARIDPCDGYIEGFGYVKINGILRIPDKRKGSPEINIKVIDEDNNCVVEVEEIKEKEESCQN